jgi:threonine synthase
VDDSSGNAGAALAAYAAAAGLPAKLFVPAYASGPKVRQIACLRGGARAGGGAAAGGRPAPRAKSVRGRPGPRVRFPQRSLPIFVAGLTTLAFEIAEDLGWVAPDHVLVPVGGGGLLLGLYYGFSLFFPRVG